MAPGQFVVAPLSTVDYLGVVWPRDESAEPPTLDPKKLREIIEVVDDVPPLPRRLAPFRRLGRALHAIAARHGASK